LIADRYAEEPGFVARGMDVWNGSVAQVESFQAQTGILYPLLRNASYVGLDASQFDADRDFYFVVDQAGVIQYRSPGLYGNRFNVAAITAAIDLLLADPVAPATWGRIKALYRKNSS
jgi:hypothetical protein